MSASIETKVHVLRGVVPDAVRQTPVSAFKAAFQKKIGQLRRLLSEEVGCAHDELVFDDINDVSCKHCGKDFTG